MVAAPDEDYPLPDLRYTIVRRIKQAVGDLVTQPVSYPGDNKVKEAANLLFGRQRVVTGTPFGEGAVPECSREYAPDVLKEKEPWLYVPYKLEEPANQAPTGVRY